MKLTAKLERMMESLIHKYNTYGEINLAGGKISLFLAYPVEGHPDFKINVSGATQEEILNQVKQICLDYDEEGFSSVWPVIKDTGYSCKDIIGGIYEIKQKLMATAFIIQGM